MKRINVIKYDAYYDIPLRGLIAVDGRPCPFIAEVDECAADDEWKVGIPSRVKIGPAADELVQPYDQIDALFRAWKQQEQNQEHPLLSNPEYKAQMAKIDAFFVEFKAGLFDVHSGWFNVNSDVWQFETR